MKEMASGEISPQNEKNSQSRIASAHIHIPRNNPAKFQKNPLDSLGGVADKGPLYIYIHSNLPIKTTVGTFQMALMDKWS